MKRAILAAMLGCWAAGQSFGPARAADPPVAGACPRPGTVLQLSNGATLTAVAASGLICQMKSSLSGDFALVGLLLRLDATHQPAKDGLAAIAGLWPLAAGKTAQYTVSDGSGQWVDSYAVGAARKVTTKAGTFQAFPVTLTEKGAEDGGAATATATSYIAPALGYTVKFDFTLPGGASDTTHDWELVSVKAP